MIGERLRKLRNSAGYTQVELAEKVNIGSRQIWRYENEETIPDAVTMAQIATVLGVSTDYLVGLSDVPRPYDGGELSPRERYVIDSMRSGHVQDAVRIIVTPDANIVPE